MAREKGPLDADTRHFIEQNLTWLSGTYDGEQFAVRPILTPPIGVPLSSDQDPQIIAETLINIVAPLLGLDPAKIRVSIHFNPPSMIPNEGSFLPLITDTETPSPAGIFFDKDEDGVYDISFAENFCTAEDEALAVVFHELSHVKLVGETDPDLNDEFLTDLAGLFFGGGVFLANASFSFQKSEQGWAYRSAGYFNQEMWAYALAVLAYLRQENVPSWVEHLNVTSQRDFLEFSEWISYNQDKMFLSVREEGQD